MRPAISVVLTTFAFALAAPGAAPAAALRVDDDRRECPDARFTSIRAAVEAAGSGDVVRVCRGRYPEQVHVATRGLRLVATPQHGATITSPPRLQHSSTIRGLVNLAADGVRLIGFDVRGPIPGSACPGRPTFRAGVAVTTGRGIRVARNRISGFRGLGQQCTGWGMLVGFVYPLPDPGVEIDRNVIADNALGILVMSNQLNAAVGPSGGVSILRNTITGFAERHERRSADGVRVAAVRSAVVRGNRFSRIDNIALMISGNRTLNQPGAYVRGNHFEDVNSAIGGQGTANTTVTHNRIQRAGSGIEWQSVGSLIQRNRVRDARHFGIRVSRDRSWAVQPPNVIRDNDFRGLRCLDGTTGDRTRGTANLWARNLGFGGPARLCRAR